MTSPSSNNPPLGMIGPHTSYGEWNRLNFQIAQSLAKMQTSLPVEVLSCTNEGGLSPVGFVNVVPMVNQVDAAGIPIPHVTIFNVPYLRVQGGANAVIIDPQEGDIGIALFASRDISKVKSTRAPANPGSNRQFSFSDAMYIGGMLNGAPEQYLRFSADGVELTSPTQAKMAVGDNSATLRPDKFEVVIGSQTLKLDTTGLWHNGVNVGYHHQHSGVTPGVGTSGFPI